MFLDCGGYVYLKENDLVLEWEKVVFIMLLNYLGLIGLGKICRWVVMVIFFCIIYLIKDDNIIFYYDYYVRKIIFILFILFKD